MKNKKASHVGMILSFVLFVTSILFLYEIISPSITSAEDKSKLIAQIEQKIPDYFEETLYNQKISLKENCCDDLTCIKIEKNILVEGLNHLVKDSEENKINSNSKGDYILIEKGETNYFNIFFSKEEFDLEESNLEDCTLVEKEEYDGAFNSKKYYFESKIESFIEKLKTQNEYYKIKKELSLPEGTDFSMVFVYNNGSRIGNPPNENLSTNIYVEQKPIYYVDLNSRINPGFLEIGVW